jgi:hypothetical protein
MKRPQWASLLRVGYWSEGNDPRTLPKVERSDEEVARLVSFLQKAEHTITYRGMAMCRICGVMLGSRCLSDGTWRWPERLEHYITEHQISLPSAFEAHVRSQHAR